MDIDSEDDVLAEDVIESEENDEVKVKKSHMLEVVVST